MRNPIISHPNPNNPNRAPISLESEVARMRASSDAAHRYAERCQSRAFLDQEQRALAIERLNSIVSMCAELNRQIVALEREALAIADTLT